MSNRKPGDYVVNAELTDEQRERFVRDCVAAGARDYGDCDDYEVSAYTNVGDVEAWSLSVDKLKNRNNVTHEYKDNSMTQPQLMRQIADAMEKWPSTWWDEFLCSDGHSDVTPFDSGHALKCLAYNNLKPKPRTYTLHVEDMPEPLQTSLPVGRDYYWLDMGEFSASIVADSWGNMECDFARLSEGRCYPDEPTAREALEKLTKAMGGGND